MQLTVMSVFSQDVKNIFDPVINPIIELVKQQVLRVQEKGENVAVSQILSSYRMAERVQATQVSTTNWVT
jgi:hypothetical protein